MRLLIFRPWHDGALSEMRFRLRFHRLLRAPGFVKRCARTPNGFLSTNDHLVDGTSGDHAVRLSKTPAIEIHACSTGANARHRRPLTMEACSSATARDGLISNSSSCLLCSHRVSAWSLSRTSASPDWQWRLDLATNFDRQNVAMRIFIDATTARHFREVKGRTPPPGAMTLRSTLDPRRSREPAGPRDVHFVTTHTRAFDPGFDHVVQAFSRSECHEQYPGTAVKHWTARDEGDQVSHSNESRVNSKIQLLAKAPPGTQLARAEARLISIPFSVSEPPLNHVVSFAKHPVPTLSARLRRRGVSAAQRVTARVWKW